ncbi:Rid family hydrolase [Phenylobacterium sp.]|uniref:Rid family hydrolase n=1 Tax=Phenylobacterium sp. TaxID=1871053 RepID=UPI0035AF4FAA
MNPSVRIIAPAPLAAVGERLGFSPAVLVNGVLHVSGQVGIDLRTGRIPEGLGEQLEHLFDALELVLAEAGASLADVFSLTSYHVGDMSAHVGAFVAARARRMTPPYPAWTSVGVTALAAPGLLVEVTALALAGPAAGGR